MTIIGRALSLLAILFVRSSWRELEPQLNELYKSYCHTTRTLVPPLLVQVLIAAEDRRFQHHPGVDIIASLRALVYTVFLRRRCGGSTIEQQLTRTVTQHYHRTLSRKLVEILLASSISRVVPKSDVPGLYLDVAYFGWQSNGIREACRRHSVHLQTVSPRDAASLIARLKYPEPRVASPERRRQIAVRTEYILQRLSSTAPLPHLTGIATNAALPNS